MASATAWRAVGAPQRGRKQNDAKRLREGLAEGLSGPIGHAASGRPAEHVSAPRTPIFERELVRPSVDADRIEHLHGFGPGAGDQAGPSHHDAGILFALCHGGIFLTNHRGLTSRPSLVDRQSDVRRGMRAAAEDIERKPFRGKRGKT